MRRLETISGVRNYQANTLSHLLQPHSTVLFLSVALEPAERCMQLVRSTEPCSGPQACKTVIIAHRLLPLHLCSYLMLVRKRMHLHRVQANFSGIIRVVAKVAAVRHLSTTPGKSTSGMYSAAPQMA